MAILIDFSQIFLAPIFVNSDAKECAGNPSSESRDIIFHLVTNSIRSLVMKNKKAFGSDIIIACDNGSWRYDEFPQYKWLRKQKRLEPQKDNINWKFVKAVMKESQDILQKFFPYAVISVPGAEGDDVIGVLTKHLSEDVVDKELDPFGNVFGTEPILIVSTDNDNTQLLKYKNVKQWSQGTRSFIKPPANIRELMIEKFVRGEPGDGLPSIKCHDNWFVDYEKGRDRAPSITKEYIKSFLAAKDPVDACLTEEEACRYRMNEKLISYDHIPENIYTNIISVYNNEKEKLKTHSKMGLMNFFVKNRMNNLLSKIGDFYP